MLYTEQEFKDPAFPFKVELKTTRGIARNFKHNHQFFQICYVMKGSCIHRVNGREAVLVKGDLFSIPPFYEHALDVIPGKDVLLAQLDFMPVLLDDSLRSFEDIESFVHFAFIQPFVEFNDRLLPQLNLSYEGQQQMEAMVAEIRGELERKQVGYPLVVKSLIQKLLVMAGREYLAFMEEKRGPAGLQANRAYFEEAVAFIQNRYHEEITLTEAAAKATMSTAYFSTMFKQLKGKTFVTYLNELRLGEAMKLLKETDRSVEDIARSIGYNNVTHFHRMFKRTAGVTPAEYRKSKSGSSPSPS